MATKKIKNEIALILRSYEKAQELKFKFLKDFVEADEKKNGKWYKAMLKKANDK